MPTCLILNICAMYIFLSLYNSVLHWNIFVPQVECVRVECEDHSDCAKAHVCLNNVCQDPCNVPNLCGENAECSAGLSPGKTVCTCQPGHTGDPDLGCVPIQYCAADNQCPSGTRCNNGICLCKYCCLKARLN